MLKLLNAYTWLPSFSDRSDSHLSVVRNMGKGEKKEANCILKNVWSSVSWIKHLLPASSILSSIVLATLQPVSFRKCALYWHYWWFDNGVAKDDLWSKARQFATWISSCAVRGGACLSVAVFALDDAVCTNVTNDVYYDTRCTHTEPHVKSGLQWLGNYTLLRRGCPFCSYLVFSEGRWKWAVEVRYVCIIGLLIF
jgi:hypothetical protein